MKYFLLIIQLFVSCTLIAVTMETLEEILKQEPLAARKKNPIKDIIYIGIGTYKDAGIKDDEYMGIEINDNYAYALSLPLFMQTIAHKKNKNQRCKVILIDTSWHNYERSSLAQFAKEHTLEPYNLHYINRYLGDRDYGFQETSNLKKYIRETLESGGVVALGIFGSAGEREETITNFYNELKQQFSDKIVLLTNPTPNFPLQAQIITGTVANWWNGYQFNPVDYIIQRIRTRAHFDEINFFVRYFFYPKKPLKKNIMLAEAKKYLDMLLRNTEERKSFFNPTFNQYTGFEEYFSQKYLTISMQDLQEKKLDCTLVSLIKLPDHLPLLEIEIVTHEPSDTFPTGELSFKFPDLPNFNYLDFSRYIHTLEAWNVPEDLLAPAYVQNLRTLEKDLYDLAQVANFR